MQTIFESERYDEYLSQLVDTYHGLQPDYLGITMGKSVKIAKFWQKWWRYESSRLNPPTRYTTLPWKPYSPRLLKALTAEDSTTESSALSLLANDEDALVRRGVARNPTTPISILKTLAEDPIVEVRISVVKNPKCPKEVLQALANDSESAVCDWVWSVQHLEDKFWLP